MRDYLLRHRFTAAFLVAVAAATAGGMEFGPGPVAAVALLSLFAGCVIFLVRFEANRAAVVTAQPAQPLHVNSHRLPTGERTAA